MALDLNKLKSPSPGDTLCQVWLKLAHLFWRRRWKCEKFTDGRTDGWTDRQTDEGRQVIRKAHLSFQLRWAKIQMAFQLRWAKNQMATMEHPIQSSLLIKQYISTYSQHSSQNVSSHRMNTTLHKNLIAKRFIINNLSNKFSWTCKESKRAWHLDNIHTGMHYTKKT